MCGILNNEIIDPYFINDTLNKEKYAIFLQDELEMLMHDVSFV